ncbi:hypothetical protein ABB07_37660 [Streptomyces incarnatus]|uniref:SnoaL-like domain-containing protein n=1 Tax=Streptomyces incarnatus TaxID=665007 RepID=A0ABM5TWU9_9ACTN|nr:hypothetical protein [Streptomyces incarnatus]AKJ15589.1 hypothetical protein ABB07_37660 [Streptomyces incarnatus]
MTAATTRTTVRAYHQARFHGDIPAAARTLSEPFHFQSPLLTSDSTHQHLSGLDAFLGIVTGVDLVSELYGETEATLVYDVPTSVPAIGTQRTSEHFHLTNGRIDTIRLIFDATPWHGIMQAAIPS